MNASELGRIVIATCNHCGLPIYVSDYHCDDRTWEERIGGEHGTCGDDHHVTTPEEHARHEGTARHLEGFAGMFKDFYCKEQ